MQSALEIPRILQKLDLRPQLPLPILLDMAFKVFNNQDEAEKDSRERWDERRAHLMAAELASALPTQLYPGTGPHGRRSQKTGPNVHFKCHQGHWSKECPR